MHLRTLRYFVTVADAGSLTAAAAAIPIAQPALTRQMRDLEAELGVQLLHRLPRGVRLTQAGVSVYESAQRMLGEAAQLTQKLARGQTVQKTTVVLGASPTLARLLLPGLFESCMATLADTVTLRSREAFTPALLDWLERGIVDMAIVTNPELGRPLSLQPLLTEPFAVVSHESMRVNPLLQPAQLSRIPLLMTSLHRGIVERQLMSVGKSLNVHAEIDSVDSIRELVLRGKWATIMPISVFKESGQPSPRIVMSEVSGVQLHRQLVLASRLDSHRNAALATMQDLIDAEFARLSRAGFFSFGASPSPGGSTG
ncbi:LysR family transcriptional regulator [Variovorax saccharolyticus]|uniref:LysR family transcriptional regulator n=1 Tax=Variovorax saccharolyticus TaxID=3053516 RepID=UPI002578CFE8|nr:LysR family transcriptional regulator [Variovorax sp. J31P216]MDM0029974.1 LysR family transcriptional regulator [Variovorax sp. J31P216]